MAPETGPAGGLRVGCRRRRDRRLPAASPCEKIGSFDVVLDAGLRWFVGSRRCRPIPFEYRARIRGGQGVWMRPDAHPPGLMAAVPNRGIVPPRPIPIKDRASILFIERGQLDVLDGSFVVVDRSGVRTHVPVGGLACLMLSLSRSCSTLPTYSSLRRWSPVAFRVAGNAQQRKWPAVNDPVGEVRRGCRDTFRKTKLLTRLIPSIEEMLAAGELDPPKRPDDAQPNAIPEEPSGDVGHRG